MPRIKGSLKIEVAVESNFRKPRGRIHRAGAVNAPLDIPVFPLIMGQRSVGASPVGSPNTIRTMLVFAVRHEVTP